MDPLHGLHLLSMLAIDLGPINTEPIDTEPINTGQLPCEKTFQHSGSQLSTKAVVINGHINTGQLQCEKTFQHSGSPLSTKAVVINGHIKQQFVNYINVTGHVTSIDGLCQYRVEWFWKSHQVSRTNVFWITEQMCRNTKVMYHIDFYKRLNNLFQY
jgi:hypothetical protein